MSDKGRIQAQQYDFPYHHLVDLEEARFGRSVGFGLDYYTYMRHVLDRVRRYATDTVLDIGCGDGFLLCQVGRDPSLRHVQATGLDLDGRAIKFAQAFAHGMPNVHFFARDVATHDKPSNLITLVETLEHIPDSIMPTFLHHVDRLLTPGGIVIASVPSTTRPTLAKHFRHYDLPLLQSHFPGYETVEAHYVTARGSLIYQFVSRMLHVLPASASATPVRNLLLGVHRRLTADVSEDRGAHVVAVLRKPETF